MTAVSYTHLDVYKRQLSNIGYNVEGGDKFIPVIGVDATDAAKDAIAKGTMSATVLQDGEAMGNAIASVALNAAAGADVYKRQNIYSTEERAEKFPITQG